MKSTFLFSIRKFNNVNKHTQKGVYVNYSPVYIGVLWSNKISA